VRHQNIVRFNLEKIADLPNRQAAAIHVSRGLQQDEVLPADAEPRGLAGILAVITEFNAMPPRKQIHEPEPGIVPVTWCSGPGLPRPTITRNGNPAIVDSPTLEDQKSKGRHTTALP